MSQNPTLQIQPGKTSVEPASTLMQHYYRVFDARTVADVHALHGVVAGDWQNRLSQGGDGADKNAFMGLVGAIRQAVPDLRWQIDEIIIAGDRVIVRGTGSGTPTAALFGVPATGRAFSIMSIDIHTLDQGRIASSYHLEDWAGAMRQLLGQ